ncbi:MAG: CvpA family protein [Elusimicrobiota bacterium]
MSGFDIAFIVIFILSVVGGAWLGSFWMAACLGGGFFGAFLADAYAIILASYLGNFMGALIVAKILIFLGVVVLFFIPGYLLSKYGLFLGFFDFSFGFLLGGLTGLVAVCLALLLVVPRFPDIEKKEAWKKSFIVKPLHTVVQNYFYKAHFNSKQFKMTFEKEAKKNLAPLVDSVSKNIQAKTKSLGDQIK